MAVWGAAVAHEDDAERAVRAALDLVAAVGQLAGSSAGDRLAARAAVATGEAAVGVTEGQGLVSGDVVNTAARLQTAAATAAVLVDERTERVVGREQGTAAEPISSCSTRDRRSGRDVRTAEDLLSRSGVAVVRMATTRDGSPDGSGRATARVARMARGWTGGPRSE